MSFDPFEARMQFLQLLRKLNASQLSIQKVVSFAIKYGSRCGEDLWECIIEECGKGSLNTRINILYFLDTLVEASLPLGEADAPYPDFVSRNLKEIVDRVVPETREGILNLKSAKQILDSWRLRRLIEPSVIDPVLLSLEGRRHGAESTAHKRSHEHAFSKNEILRRMEEDRERHKRLRERIWILPIPSLLASKPTSALSHPSPSTSSGTSPFTPASPSRRPQSRPNQAQATMPPPPPPRSTAQQISSGQVINSAVQISTHASATTALEVEFEQTWDGVSDLDEEESAKMRADMLLADLELPST